MNDQKITFYFGKNWEDFSKTITDEQVKSAIQDIEEWIGKENILNKCVLDIGCGSGIHSLAYYLLGAKTIDSFDYDSFSVKTTQSIWEKNNKPENWKMFQASILDTEFLQKLGMYDIVYSWGVLHHTGEMWKAIENAANLVKPGGYFWISIYAKGPNYTKHLNLKRKYNAATLVGKRWMEYVFILKVMGWRVIHLQNPLTWNAKKTRGMDTYHDIVDWLGGLPHEVASEDEIVQFCRTRGMILERIKVIGEGGCNTYVFKRSSA